MAPSTIKWSSRFAVLRSLGSSQLTVHPLALGGNVFGWTADRDASFAILDAYVGAGGNFIDTADLYTSWAPGNRGGESETIIGEWLRRRRPRDGVVIATKVGMGSEDIEKGLHRRQVLAACDASLRRLQVETIDLYYAHQDYPEPALEETLGAFDEIVRAGKVRYIAASNYSAPRLREALEISEHGGLASYVALQPRLNLVERAGFGKDLADACTDAGLGVAVHSALAGGFLTGKYRAGEALPDTVRADRIGSDFLTDDLAVARLASADAVAARHGVGVAQVALAWALAQPAVTSVIASASSTTQVGQLIEAATLELSPDDLDELNRPHMPVGDGRER